MKRWVITFGGSSLLCVLMVFGALWAFNGFNGLGLSLGLTITLAAGIVITVALGVGLMGLVFASDRSGVDAEAFKSHRDKH
jgi:hypothetical protein